MNELDRTIAEGRAFVEEYLLTDTCRITRAGQHPEGEDGWNEESMTYDDPPRVTVWEGPCRLQIKADINSNVVEATSGDREWTYQTATLEVPIVGTEAILPDMVAEFLTARYDENLVGRHFFIEGVYRKSQSTRRRYRVKEVTG